MSGTAEDGLMTLLEAMLTLAAREARRPKPPTVKPGGYPEENFLDLSEKDKEEFTCNICYQIIKECMQCINHHKFCHSCLLVWSTTGVYANRIKCPVCRTHGYYFRNDDIDDQIGTKKVKCHLETCKWSGECKLLLSHRHTTYGEHPDLSRPNSSVSSIPRLSQVPPHVPAGRALFAGTGLTTRGTTESPRFLPGRGRMNASTSPLSIASHETVTELPQASGASRASSTARRRVPPVRSSNNSRIVFNHTGPNHDGNNNIGAAAESGQSEASLSESSESVASSAFAPRPPSAPRTSANTVNIRRLPRITNPPPPRGRNYQPPQALALGISSTQRPADSLGEIRDRLQESRHRLDNLMSSFSGELDRRGQEMADLQRERERQRQEQLDEVRELGQRLGQVASELRRLLEHRRHLPALNGDEDDDDEDL